MFSGERSLLFVKKTKTTGDIVHNKNFNLKSKYEYLVLIARETV